MCACVCARACACLHAFSVVQCLKYIYVRDVED